MVNNLFTFVVFVITTQMSKKLILEGILHIRKEKGISQKDIAEKLNISQSMYNQLEKGNQNISLERLEEILNALQTDILSILKVVVNDDEINSIIAKQHEVIKMLEAIKTKK